MRSHRTIISIAGTAVALAVALPAPALGKSLLSGYGAPGEGNQAILGSALLHGSRGGGGSAGGGPSNSSGSSATSGAGGESTSRAAGEATSGQSPPGGSEASGSEASGAGVSGGARSAARAGRARHPGRGVGRKVGRNAQPQAPARTVDFYPATERLLAGQRSGGLGLSGAELIYILLIVGVLVFMGVTTRRLAQISATGRHR